MWRAVWLLILAGCTGLPYRADSIEFGAGHFGTPAVRADVRRVRDLLSRGEPRAALVLAEDVLARDPQNVNARRAWQDILRERGRLGRAAYEAEAQLHQHPKSSVAQYLAGRLIATTAGKSAAFARARQLDPNGFWAWYGTAFTWRNERNAAANAVYKGLFAASQNEPIIGSAYAASLRLGKRFAAAIRVHEAIGKHDRGRAALGKAEIYLSRGKLANARNELVVALRERPFDPAVHAVVARFLRGYGGAELRASLVIDPARLEAFAARAPGLLARLLTKSDPHAAIALLRSIERRTAQERFEYRRLLLQTGDVRGFLDDLVAALPLRVVDTEQNQVRALWLALRTGPFAKAADPLARHRDAIALVAALRDAGCLEFGLLVASQALLIHPEAGGGDSAKDLRTLRAELRKEIAFEAAVVRTLSRGYGRFLAHQKARDLQSVLAQLREHSLRILGKDVVGRPKLFDLPFIGRLVDSLGPGLPRHLTKYNKHLVMGQRGGRPTEGMILRRLAVRRIPATPLVPLPPRTVEVVGERRELSPFDQGDLAGIALLNHYVIDFDEVRSWSGAIERRRRIAREDDSIVLRDPLPKSAPELEPLGAAWRLALLSPVKDKDLVMAVFDVIRWHEQGHMVDFLYFLPVTVHPLRALALTIRNGLSALQVTAEMEGRAELVALAVSPHTRIVTAHIAGFLAGDGGESPHAHGFRALARELVDRLRVRGVKRPEVRYWHELDPQLLRDTARALLAEIW